MEDDSSTKHKLRSSICFSCCFGRDFRREDDDVEPDQDQPRFIRASSSWLRSRAQELPELKDRCRNLMSRIGRSRRQSSSDYRYDPLSYALNFDEGSDESVEEERRSRNFSARLPASPLAAGVKISHEITCN